MKFGKVITVARNVRLSVKWANKIKVDLRVRILSAPFYEIVIEVSLVRSVRQTDSCSSFNVSKKTESKRIRIREDPGQVDLLAAVGAGLLLAHDAPAADAELVEDMTAGHLVSVLWK